MKLAQIVLVLASTLVLTAQTEPPPANPVVSHYRAYRAALESGDLATAETEADAALAASVARDGDGGRTGVLAINLAQVRLSRDRREEAQAPALQASNISARADSGVDPLLARLVLGRSELTAARGRQASGRLNDALHDAATRADLRDDAYFAAADLGRYYANQNLFVTSAEAWALAAQLADPTQPERRIAYAEARIGEGIARYTIVARAQDARLNRPTDSRIAAPTDEYRQADAAFAEAERILRPLAYVDGGGMTLTGAQSMYALVRAWRAVIGAYLISTGQQRLVAGARAAEADAIDYAPVAMNSAPSCEVRIITEPRPNFPPGAEQRVVVGAVVVRMLVNAEGEVEDARVAAAVPQAGFREQVERVAPQWRVERLETSPSTCAMPRILFFSFQFQFY